MNIRYLIRRKMASGLCFVAVIVFCLVCLSVRVYSQEQGRIDRDSGTNISYQKYRSILGNGSDPVRSYLVRMSEGYMRVDGYGQIIVTYYDKNLCFLREKIIAKELPLFGAFHESGDYYYIVTGQENLEEDPSKDTYCVTKYDKNWKKIKSLRISGVGTQIPFHGGSCRVASNQKRLIIHTCQQWFKSADGKNHQANITLYIDINTLEYQSSLTNVSHSFNQFILLDEDSEVTVDHGDAYPRAIVLSSSGGISSHILNLAGNTGDNFTFASVGGLEASDSTYLVTGAARDQTDYFESDLAKNVFISSVDKKTGEQKFRWLTHFTGDNSATNSQIVKINDNRFMLLWGYQDKVYYMCVDKNGEAVSEIYSLKGYLSDCKPIVSNGKVIWFIWSGNWECFYEIPVDNLSAFSIRKSYESAHIETEPASPQVIGTDIRLKGFYEGTERLNKFCFIVTDDTGKETEWFNNTNYTYTHCGWSPTKPGIYKVRVDIYNDVTGEFLASSKPLTFEIKGKDISKAVISGVSGRKYSGKKIKQTITVKYDGTELQEGKDYTVSYKNNKNAGKASLIVTGIGNYAGNIVRKFTISKAAQPMKVKAAKKTVKAKRLKKKNQAVSKVISVKKAQGKVTYAKVKKGSSARLTVNKKTGAILVKKGTKKGTYKIRVKVTAAGNKNYKKGSVTVTVSVKVS